METILKMAKFASLWPSLIYICEHCLLAIHPKITKIGADIVLSLLYHLLELEVWIWSELAEIEYGAVAKGGFIKSAIYTECLTQLNPALYSINRTPSRLSFIFMMLKVINPKPFIQKSPYLVQTIYLGSYWCCIEHDLIGSSIQCIWPILEIHPLPRLRTQFLPILIKSIHLVLGDDKVVRVHCLHQFWWF